MPDFVYNSGSMHFVTPSLIVGNLEDAQQPPSFVSNVLFLAAEHPIAPPTGVTFECVPLMEFQEADPATVRRAIEWLERYESNGRVLVCCRAGMGRSVSVVIAYLCCVKGMHYLEAVELLKSRRPGATPLPNLKQTIEQVRLLRQVRAGLGQSPS